MHHAQSGRDWKCCSGHQTPACDSAASQAQLEEGANFLDKASVVAKRVTGALRELAPSRGSGGEELMDSVSDHLESAGERVQKVCVQGACRGLLLTTAISFPNAAAC